MTAHQTIRTGLRNQNEIRLDIRVFFHTCFYTGSLYILFRNRAGYPQRKVILEPKILNCSSGPGNTGKTALIIHSSASADHTIHDFRL